MLTDVSSYLTIPSVPWTVVVTTLITICIFVFVNKRTKCTIIMPSTVASISDDLERQKRRDHLAAVSERRMLLQLANNKWSTSIPSADCLTKELVRKSAIDQNEVPEWIAAPTLDSTCIMEKKTCLNGMPGNCSDSQLDCKNETLMKQAIEESKSDNAGIISEESTSGSSNCLFKKEDVIDCNNALSENYEIPSRRLETTNQVLKEVEPCLEKNINVLSLGDAGILPEQSNSKSIQDHKERHANAIAKIQAKKLNHLHDDASKPFLAISILLTSAPESQRVNLSIPESLTAKELRMAVSKATSVPLPQMRLIFCGKVITDSTKCITREYGIQTGSTLHVVGKPQTKTREESIEDALPTQIPLLMNDGLGFTSMIENDRSIHEAAAQGDMDVLYSVASSNPHLLHAVDSNGWLPLHEAVRAGQDEVVSFLVREGVEQNLDVWNVVTNFGNGWSPLALALAYQGELHSVTLILRGLGAELLYPGRTVFEHLDD